MALRLSLFYASFFAVVGVQLPYWPAWMAARGMDAGQIGTLLAITGVARIFAAPIMGALADRLGRPKTMIVILAAGALITNALYAPAHGYWPIFAVTVASSIFFSTLLPVADGVTVVVARASEIDYGRVRLWGSIAFIVVSSASGAIIGAGDDALILWLVLGALALTVGATLALPDPRHTSRVRLGAWRALPGAFWVCAAAASLIQASHSVYYGFATLHWRAVGLTDTMIGALWSEGVIAEIALFAVSARLPLGPRAMLLLAAAGGIVRWTVLGTTDALPALIAVQLLHAMTFGAAHLALVRFILREIPPELSTTAQGMAAAVASTGTAIFLTVAGMLYAGFGAPAYFAMALLAAIGGAAAHLIRRMPPSPPSPSPASA